MRVLALALVACTPPVRPTVPFDATNAATLSIAATATVCGSSVQLPRVSVTMRDGTIERYMPPSELAWTAATGSVRENEAGFIYTGDPLALLDGDVPVTVALANHRAVSAKIVLVPTFRCAVTADVRGQGGAIGEPGPYGLAGMRGNEVPGHDGGDGKTGGPGNHGPDVEVAVTVVATKRFGELAYARVTTNDGRTAVNLFAVDGGSLEVAASGGAGGRGGFGGAGGNGGRSRATGNGCTDPGNGGRGGRGGDGGDGGDAGSVTVRVDKAYPQLAGQVHVDVSGGRGGPPGDGGPGGRGGKAAGEFVDAKKLSTAQDCTAMVDPGKPGQPGPPGQHAGHDGRPGQSSVVMDTLAAMFPDGVTLTKGR